MSHRSECRRRRCPSYHEQQTAAALASARRARRWRVPTAAAGLVVVVAAVTAASMWLFLGPSAGPGAIVVRSEINTFPVSLLGGFPDNTNVPFSLNRPSRTVITLTPDGRFLLFAGSEDRLQRLHVHDLAAGTTAAIPGTESADAPFLSPDGRWAGFWAADARALKKFPLDGSGPPVEICKARSAYGASWGDDDTIVFVQVPDDGLWRVSASGGSAPRRIGLVDRRDEAALMSRFGVVVTPAVVYLRDGEATELVARMRDWPVFAQACDRLLASVAAAPGTAPGGTA